MRVYKVVGYPTNYNIPETSIYGFFRRKKDALKYIKVLTLEDNDDDIGYYVWLEKIEMDRKVFDCMPETGKGIKNESL